MYFAEPSLLLHKVMPISLQFSQAQGQTYTLIYQSKATGGGQTHANCGPLAPNILQGVWLIGQQGSLESSITLPSPCVFKTKNQIGVSEVNP